MGERCDDMGEVGVDAKVGRSGFPPPPLLLLLCVLSVSCSGAGGEGPLVRALRISSRVVMRSPDAENRREKTTPESWSKKDIFGSAAVGTAVTVTVTVEAWR
jgi:hypothetical protein